MQNFDEWLNNCDNWVKLKAHNINKVMTCFRALLHMYVGLMAFLRVYENQQFYPYGIKIFPALAATSG